jgi:hypothetical protein
MKNVSYVLAALAGFLVSMLVNGSLINVSASIVAPPAGADMTTVEGIKAALPLLEPKHYIMPFLAHALGTFCGAFVAALIAPAHKFGFAMAIGFLGLAGGIAAAFLIPAPRWFIVLDLVGAYLPFAFVASALVPKARGNALVSDQNADV